MVEVLISNHKSKLNTTLDILSKLRNEFRIKALNYFWAEAYRSRRWDGYVNYITSAGYISTGLLPKLVEHLTKNEIPFELVDNRNDISIKKQPRKVGDLELRDYQVDSVKSITTNRLLDLPFHRGIINEATNAGKNLIAAALFKCFPKDTRCLFLVNRQHIYKQAKEEMGKLLGDQIGHIGPDGIKWARFMICMAQTTSKKISQFKYQLGEFDMVIVDECHYADGNTFKHILANLINSTIRIGMSGTPFKHKDKNKNERIREFFGEQLHAITNQELIDLGFSTKPQVAILEGNTIVKIPGNYRDEERSGIILSKERNRKVIKRVRYHLNRKRAPMLVIAKYHEHTEKLYRLIKKKFPEQRMEFIHVGVKDRLHKLDMFKKGELDILVSSMLIKEGQNLPLIRSLIIAGGGDSVTNVLQLVGRALRKHHSKDIVYIDDFWDIGSYLKRHSKHRLKVYIDEGFKVLKKYEH